MIETPLIDPFRHVVHDVKGVGVVARVSFIIKRDEVVSSFYMVEFDGENAMVGFSEAAAIEELTVLEDNIQFCKFCASNLQGDEIPRADWIKYSATHFSRAIRLTDSHTGVDLGYQCPDCEKVWSAYDGKRIKRVAPLWLKAGAQYPEPISNFGPFHLRNIRKYRIKTGIGVKGDFMDRAIWHEQRRYWWMYPLVVLLAPALKALHDRRRKRKSAKEFQNLLEALKHVLAEDVRDY